MIAARDEDGRREETLAALPGLLSLARQVIITSTKPETNLELKDPSSTLKDLSVEVSTLETGRTYRLTAKLTDESKASQTGTITPEAVTPAPPEG